MNQPLPSALPDDGMAPHLMPFWNSPEYQVGDPIGHADWPLLNPWRKVRTFGMGEFGITLDVAESLVAYSLGSCLGVSLYDPAVRVAGLAHFVLPLSRLDPDKAREKPAMFVDTGMEVVLQAMFDLGASRDHLIVKIAGASRMLDETDSFRIGERNLLVARKMLWKNSLNLAAEDTGGAIPRTLIFDMNCGRTFVQTGRERREL